MQNIIKNQYLFFVSLIGIVLVSSVMATTYAYQTLRVDYVSGSKEDLTITSGVLDVSFDITNRIDIKNMPLLPSYKTSDYIEFVIDNTKSTSEVGYRISLVELDYSEQIRDGYFRYTLVRVNEDESLEEIGNGSFANITDNYIDLYFDNGFYDYIDAGKSYTIRLYLWFKESKTVDQSKLLNTYFKGKIYVSSVFSSDVSYEKNSEIFEVGTLADKIISNAMLGINGTQFSPNTMTIPAMDTNEEYEKTISTIEDNYGISYYFRGNVLDNYINFNNMCFRIVRILGDGSIKLVLEDSKQICENVDTNLRDNGLIRNDTEVILTKNDILNKVDLDGYLTNQLNNWYEINNFASLNTYLKLDTTCHNGTSSYKVLDLEKNMYVLRSNSEVYGKIDNKLVSMNEDNYKLQCDKNINYGNAITIDDTMYCNEWNYNIYRRLYGIDLNKEVAKLTCNDNEKTERYISLLNPDEVILAGYLTENSNVNYLNYTKNWWTSSVAYVSLDKEYMFYVGDNLSTDNKDSNYGIRPTITLNSNVLYDKGDGTKNNPYNIKIESQES